MRRAGNTEVGRALERLVLALLLLALVIVVWLFGFVSASSPDELFVDYSHGSLNFILQRVWIFIFPLTAIAATRLRYGADRLLALRRSRVGPVLPMLLVASLLLGSLFGLGLVLSLFGKYASAETQLGALGWLGVVLITAYAWFGTLLLPRITASFAGVLAGLALVAIVGDPLAGSCWSWPNYDPSTEYTGALGGWYFIFYSPLATIIWAMGSWILWTTERTGTDTHGPRYLLPFAAWSGTIILAMALAGTLSFTEC